MNTEQAEDLATLVTAVTILGRGTPVRVSDGVVLTPSDGTFYALSAGGNLLRNESLARLRENVFEAEKRADKLTKFKVPEAFALVETPRDGWQRGRYLGFVRGKGHRFELADGSFFDTYTSWAGPSISRHLDRLEDLRVASRAHKAAEAKLKELKNAYTTSSYATRANDAGEILEATQSMLRILHVEYARDPK